MYCCPYCDRTEFTDEDDYFEHVSWCELEAHEDELGFWSEEDD